jgi:hypothetical protein
LAVDGDQVMQRREGLARGEDVLVVAAAAGVRPLSLSGQGHQGGGGAVVRGWQGQWRRGGSVLVSPGELSGEERVAGHDLVDVVARDVEVGDGVESPELDGGDVVRLRRLLLRPYITSVIETYQYVRRDSRYCTCMQESLDLESESSSEPRNLGRERAGLPRAVMMSGAMVKGG